MVASGTASAQVSPSEAERIRMRQDLATMEGVLQRAIVSGAENVMAQMRRVVPDRPRLAPAHVSGFRLDGHGLVFHVQVPQLTLPILYFVNLREMQERNMWMQMQQLRTQVSGMPAGPERTEREQQLAQIAEQLALGNLRPTAPTRGQVGAQSLVPPVPVGVTQSVAIEPSAVDDPYAAYTREVKAALVDALLKNGQAFSIRPDESLTIVARDGEPSNPQIPGDSIDSSIWVMSVKGSVLSAFQKQTITLEEARRLVEVTEQ
jgi:hypothetical protein